MKAHFVTRRDKCWSVGRRALLLPPERAAIAWLAVARDLVAMGERDLPKFNDLLRSIRAATISEAGRQP